MQVNLHGSPCNLGVFLYCFGHRKKNEILHQQSTKIRQFDPQSPRKKISGAPSHTLSPVVTPTPLGAFGTSTLLAPSALDFAPNFNSSVRLWCRIWLCLCLLMPSVILVAWVNSSCSNDLQGHPKSMIFVLPERAYAISYCDQSQSWPYLAPFPKYGYLFVENHIFLFLLLTPNIKMFLLHCIPQILFSESLDTWLIIRAKVFFYDLTLSHNTSLTYRHTDGETDDNRTTQCHKREPGPSTEGDGDKLSPI